MKIDNRVFIPFAMPFILLGMTRLVFLLAGASWVAPELFAILSLLGGGIFGGILCHDLFERKTNIGYTTIGKPKPELTKGGGKY